MLNKVNTTRRVRLSYPKQSIICTASASKFSVTRPPILSSGAVMFFRFSPPSEDKHNECAEKNFGKHCRPHTVSKNMFMT